jgi:arylformamidase
MRVARSRLIDVTISIHPEMVQWRDEAIVQLDPLTRTPMDRSNVTRLTITTHTGTHVDAYRHFMHGGATIDELPLDRWIGPCWVADCSSATPEITLADLEGSDISPGVERLIIKTTNSTLWSRHPNAFIDTYVGLSLPAAEWVVERGIQLVGIDYLSIGPFHTTIVETHRALLGNGVVIVEGLDLSEVAAGAYELLCFPLKIVDGDGAPARVALRGPIDTFTP